LRGIEAMPLTRQLVNDLSMRLPGVVDEVRWNPQQRGTLWAKVSVAGVEYLFVERDVLPDADYPLTGLGVLAMTGALSLAGAIAIQRRINRPLSRLVEAARLIARGETPPPLSEREPREIATVASAFNQMTSSLAQLDAERAIVLAGVSHDLRTPLAKMRLAIEMLNRNGDTSLIDSMLRSTQEMDQITEQFLHFARASGVEEMSCSDLNQIVRECAAIYEAAARAPILDLRELPSVRLHLPSIRRAIYNLIENAYRYGAGEVRLTSGCGNGTVFVSVLDRGPGIAQSEIEAVRKPFVRGASSAGTGGAGLGLAIVDRIIRLHGGRLELLARDGGGLEARIQLPPAPADPMPAPE
jgi:two-component system osmolarity sensor histidine kinase EnvZ